MAHTLALLQLPEEDLSPWKQLQGEGLYPWKPLVEELLVMVLEVQGLP